MAFRDRQTDIKRATTCTCRACQNIPSLDLKFIVHHGDYILQQVRGIREMVGSDVNLVHRLSKNHVTEATGWRAYLMITEPCLAHLDLKLEGTHEQMESYEHLGEIKTINIDMHQRYNELKEARHVFLTEKDAHLYFTVDFPTPPPLTWEWLQDPSDAISGAAESTGIAATGRKVAREAEPAIIARTANRSARKSRWTGVRSIIPRLIRLRMGRRCSAKPFGWNLCRMAGHVCMITRSSIFRCQVGYARSWQERS